MALYGVTLLIGLALAGTSRAIELNLDPDELVSSMCVCALMQAQLLILFSFLKRLTFSCEWHNTRFATSKYQTKLASGVVELRHNLTSR